jgi:iron complex outermembrane receptor protein
MIKKIGSLFLIGSVFFVKAQEKTSDIETIEIQGKFISTPYKSANQNITVITKEEIANSPAKVLMKCSASCRYGHQKKRCKWSAE